jgi:DNA anti-recombination protein RmuC
MFSSEWLSQHTSALRSWMTIGKNRILGMIDLKLLLIAIGASFSIGAASSWWITADYKEAKYTAVLEKQKSDAAQALSVAVAKAQAEERENNRLSTELEIANAENRKKLDELQATNLRLASEFSGLYDRYSTNSNCSVPSTSKPSVDTPAAPTGAKLSAQLTELLLSESRRADEAAAYAKTCYEWVKKLGAK